jgi:hypothetical protein
MSYCPICNNRYTAPEKVREVSITFTSNGNIYTEWARRFTDGFYEITKGRFKGNLVHIWDIVKP